jgi:hypothetical protein
MRAAIAVFSFALLVLATVRPAQAANPQAESLFREAIALMKSGSFADACPKLEASQELEAKSGTLITLASCNEQLGKTATAWVQYKEAAALARSQGRADHVNKATELADAIEPKLVKLRIDAPADADVSVTLDGKPVLAATFGVPFAIDPGPHTVEASAPGKVVWSTSVDVVADGGIHAVTIAELEPVPQPEPPPVVPVPAPLPPPLPPPAPVVPPWQPPPPKPKDGVPVWAWVTGGLGVASLAVAVGFAIDQRAASAALDDNCGGEARDRCPPTYDFDGDHARETRDFGLFVGFGIGGAALVVAGVAGVLASKPWADARHVTPWVELGPMGVAVRF